MRRIRCGFLTCSLIASTALISTAQAADLHSGSSTRNWGGTWFGFGIGHSNHAYKGDYGSTACFTSGTFSGEANYESNCQAEFDPSTGEAGVGVSANASSNGVQADTAAASGVQSPNNAASVGAAATLEGNPVNVSVSVDPGVPSAEETASGNYAAGDANSNSENNGLVLGVGIGDSDTPGSFQTQALAFTDPSTGVAGALVSSQVSSASGTASAYGFGLAGLPTDLSSNDGGFAGSVHVRRDYHGESNWVIGSELELMWTPDNDTQLSNYLDGSADAFNLSFGRNIQATTSMLASARLRVGYAMGDYLLYGTGGIAYADFEATSRTGFEYNDQQSTSTAEAFDTKSGHAWGGVVGGGVSAFMNDDTVVSLEGLYYNFDKDIRFEDGSVKLDDAFSVMVKVSIRPN